LLDLSVQPYPGQGLKSFAENRTLSESFVNLTDGDMTGTLRTFVTASGYSYAAEVPEPKTYAMILAGLGLAGLAHHCGKRNASV